MIRENGEFWVDPIPCYGKQPTNGLGHLDELMMNFISPIFRCWMACKAVGHNTLPNPQYISCNGVAGSLHWLTRTGLTMDWNLERISQIRPDVFPFVTPLKLKNLQLILLLWIMCFFYKFKLTYIRSWTSFLWSS